MWLLLACVADPLTCGPGTVRQADLCVVDPAGSDSGTPDITDTHDTTGPTDTADTTDSGDTDTGVVGPIEVWILAGQSNMDGYSYTTGLPPAWRLDAPEVPLYWSGWGTFRALAPASYGGGYFTGPEVAMGRTLAQDGARVALVKHAVNGSYLATDWYPGEYPDDPSAAAAWQDLVTTMRGAAAELDAAGEPWRWAGLAWMQGESDATTVETASVYEANLSAFVARLREEAATPDLPVAIGLIACDGLCVYLDEVRAAQQAIADADPAVTTFETNDLARNPYDGWHYDGPSIRVLGQRFAQVLRGEALQPAPTAALRVESSTLTPSGTSTLGWSFTLDRTVTLTDIGAYTPFGEYIWNGTEVGVWDADTAELLLVDAVPSRYQAPTSYRDGFWYVAIDPVTLPAGRYVIGLVSWVGDEHAMESAVTVGPGVGVEAPASHDGSWLAFPEPAESTGEGVGFLGPGFLYDEG